MGYGFLLRKPKNTTPVEAPWEPTGEIYGVDIQRFVSNTNNRVVYIDDAVDSVPARGNDGNFIYGSWENRFPFNRIRPCLIKNGVVQGYLKKDDYNYYEDGTIADIRNLSQGDVFVEIPTVYYKFERKSPTKDLYVRYSDTKHDDTWAAYAHTDTNGVIKDNLYVGVYLDSGTGGLMYSKSGEKPRNYTKWNEFQSYAASRGAGYGVFNHHQLTLMQILYVVMFKTTESYTTLGQGIQTGGLKPTGDGNKFGMFYGDQVRTNPVKFCGIEDIFGHALQYIDGMHFNSSKQFVYNGEVYGYGETTGSYVTMDVHGTNKLGFIPSEVASSSTSSGLYYQGLGLKQANTYFQHGTANGLYNDRGMFSYTANVTNTSSVSNRSARLVYL